MSWCDSNCTGKHKNNSHHRKKHASHSKYLYNDSNQLISEETGMPVIYAEDPMTSIVLGAGKALENIDLLRKVENGHKLSRA